MFIKFLELMFAKTEQVRPQILMAMLMIAALALAGTYIGYKMNANEIVTASLGAGIPVISVLGMKVLEKD